MDATQRLESTARLLRQVQGGNAAAQTRLAAIYLPILRRWAFGHLPVAERDRVESLTRATLTHALGQIHNQPPRHEGAFLCALREALLAVIGAQWPVAADMSLPPQLAQAVGPDTFSAYAQALRQLPVADREALLLRMEFGFSFQEIADAVELADAGQARARVREALVKLAGLLESAP